MKTINIRFCMAILTLVLIGAGVSEAGTKELRYDSTGGDCSSIGTWDYDKATCTLTADLSDTIKISSGAIILDGGGYTITGSELDFGISINSQSFVTVKNVKIRNFSYGIGLISSRNNTVIDNELSGNKTGIYLQSANDNTIINNNVNSNTDGINLYYSSNYNRVTRNTITTNTRYGVIIQLSQYNTISDNVAMLNNWHGIYVIGASSNTFSNNVSCFHSGLSTSYSGFYFDGSSSSILSGNIARANYYGIFISNASNTASVSNNVIMNNVTGIYIHGSSYNQIYKNDFLENTGQAIVWSGSINNSFSQPPPTGGNYWSDNSNCYDGNGDGYCDSLYAFSGGQDLLPWRLPINPILDSSPPTTTVDASPTWQKSAFTVNLNCTDNEGGSGCQLTRFKLDSGSWQTGTSVNIATNGDHLIQYYSIDGKCNPESTNSFHAKLDTSPPTVTISSPQPLYYAHSDNIVLSFTAQDQYSGLAQGSPVATIDGIQGVTDGQSLYLLALSLGSHTLTVTAYDNAGNMGTGSMTFYIIATIDSLIDAVNYYAQNGEIDSYFYKTLIGTLKGAKDAEMRGNINAERNKLDNFINQIKAQTGKHISTEAANLLISDTNYVMGQLQQ